jgi:hypothetical protein
VVDWGNAVEDFVSSVEFYEANTVLGIRNEAWKAAGKIGAKAFAWLFNCCHNNPYGLPKEARSSPLVLIYKQKMLARELPSSYRPISLMNTANKLLESSILRKIQNLTETEPDSLGNRTREASVQHGFVKGKSTMTQILEARRRKTVFQTRQKKDPYGVHRLCRCIRQR